MRRLLLVVIMIFLFLYWLIPSKGDERDKKVFAELYSEDSISINLSKYVKQGVYEINDTIDLQGKTWYLPPNLHLRINKGFIKNGIVFGNKTHLEYRGVVFDSIRIKGNWIVPVINTSMFANLRYENSLKDVFALSNPKIVNEIFIGEGSYYLSALSESDQCLMIDSNTNVTIDGDIILNPNSYSGYRMIFIKGNNIVLQGKGVLVGDRDSHLGENGEWGMGIFISGGSNITIKGIRIKDCWGDCVYIKRDANNVIIDSCVLEKGRRQGISVISAHNIQIKNCLFKGIGGTSPGYAIDIEPNNNDIVGNVMIDNIKVDSCIGGISGGGRKKGARVGYISVTNSYIGNTIKYPLHFVKCDSIVVENSDINVIKNDIALDCADDECVSFIGNRIHFPDFVFANDNQEELLNSTIRIVNTREKKVNNNKVLK